MLAIGGTVVRADECSSLERISGNKTNMPDSRRHNKRIKSVYASAEDVIRRILKMELSGDSLKCRDMRDADPDLNAASIRHFGCWSNALKAAGIDHEKVFNRRKWTVERVLKAIRDLDRRGIALNYASVLKADGGLPQAASKLLGSWNEALCAAGFDPDAVRLSRRPWTRRQIIELIQSRAAEGLPISSYRVEPQSAEIASRRLFGSWKQALRAASVPNPSAEFPKWTKVSVVESILLRQQLGQPLHCLAAAQQDSQLYDAARRHFGGWGQALSAAGIDPESVRRRRPPWNRDAIIATLQAQARTNRRVDRRSEHSESFVHAARRLFGSWHQTLAAAGIPTPSESGRR